MSIQNQLLSIDRLERSPEVLSILFALANAAEKIFEVLQSDESGDFEVLDGRNSSGDFQTRQDVVSHDIFVNELSRSNSIGYLASEESNHPIRLGSGNLSVSLDPFDGSKAHRFGIPPGSIFGVYKEAKRAEDFTGRNLRCSGLFLFSQKIELLVALDSEVFLINSRGKKKIPSLGNDERFVCANASNIRFWQRGWGNFFNKNVLEAEQENHFNSRWFGSLAAHVKMTVLSGGFFMYPPDERSDYQNGHLRLVYEAMPIAFLIESCGGGASNGTSRILDLVPSEIHQKTPLAFGEVAFVSDLKVEIDRCLRLPV